MVPFVAALLLAQASPTATPRLDARIADSAAAAERLQGPLDGGWTLRDRTGRVLYVFVFSDPASGGPLEGAWREAGSGGEPAPLSTVARMGDRLWLSFPAPASASPVRIRLRRSLHDVWTGWMARGHRQKAVTLERDENSSG